ncbi:hypothetical protein D3C86_326130 [compost metagenome]
MQRLLGLNVLDKTKDEYLRDLAELATDPTCLVFIDTNIVSYMYKLHEAARREFFLWADGLVAAGRLAIPSWCAGEYLARVRDDQLKSYLPKSREQDQPQKALEAMLDTATLFVDETILASIEFTEGRDAFLAQFRDAIKALKPFSRAFQHQFDAGAVHKEILAHLGPAVIDSDVVALCERASKEGPARVAHRIPPAFRDEDKPENKLGDLIIWYEIVEWAKQKKDDFSKVLFVTNDQKSDWVYAPPRRTNIVQGGRRAVANDKPRIKIIDPRLTAEFERFAGHGNIAISSLPSLVEGISRVNPTQVGQLAAAIQINLATQAPEESRNGSDENTPASLPAAEADPSGTTSSSEEGGEAETEVPTGPDDAAPASDGANQTQGDPDDVELLEFDEEGYRDAAYEADAPGEINEIIGALKSSNWYVQNPAIEKLKALRGGTFSATSWFVLGRNIYQAACGNAQKAMNFMVNLDIQLGRFDEDAADATLAGMAFEIYFDGQAQLRAKGKSGYLDKVLSVLASDRYSRVRKFLRAKLVAADATLLYMPGEKIELTLLFKSTDLPKPDALAQAGEEKSDDEKMRELASVTLEEVELVVDKDGVEEHSWGGSRRSYTAEDVCSRVSTVLLVPRWALKRKFEPSVRPDTIFRLPEGKRLWVKSAAPGPQE